MVQAPGHPTPFNLEEECQWELGRLWNH